MEEAKRSETVSDLRFFSIGIILMLLLLVRGTVLDLSIVQDSSMEPTLKPEEHLIINRLAYISGKPQPGDLVSVIITEPRARYGIVTLKRIVAVGGQTVEIKNGRLYVDGKEFIEPYLIEQTVGEYGPKTVPPDHYFVLGDNRNYSMDSRSSEIGFVSSEAIRGKAFFVYWPLKSVRML
ncbi:MAG TPA: signal peptidase I [Clostridia bacterium]|nr:signal peptidase I [Clostridia bacterium]